SPGPSTRPSQTDLLRQPGAHLCVVGCNDRVGARQAPLLPVLFRRELVVVPKMPLEHREMLAAFETDQIAGGNRVLHRNSRFTLYDGNLWIHDPAKGVIDLADQLGHIASRYRVIGEMRRHNLCRKGEQFVPVGHLKTSKVAAESIYSGAGSFQGRHGTW